MHVLATYLIGAALHAAPALTETDATREAVASSVAACLASSGSQASTTKSLTAAGWQLTAGNDRVLTPIFTLYFHMNRSDGSIQTLQSAIESSLFMAASVLDDTALPSAQRTLTHDTMTLSIYELLSQKKSGGMLSDRAWIAEPILRDARFDWAVADPSELYAFKDPATKLVFTTGESPDVSQLDIAQALSADAAAELPDTKSLKHFWDNGHKFIGDISVVIVPEKATP